MSDIFEAFEGTTPPATLGANGEAKKPRKPRGPRKVQSTVAPSDPIMSVASTIPAPGPKKPRKKRAANGTARAAPASAVKGGRPKNDLGGVLTAMVGLSADEAKMVASAVRTLEGVGKKSRGKIVTALGRIFT